MYRCCTVCLFLRYYYCYYFYSIVSIAFAFLLKMCARVLHSSYMDFFLLLLLPMAAVPATIASNEATSFLHCINLMITISSFHIKSTSGFLGITVYAFAFCFSMFLFPSQYFFLSFFPFVVVIVIRAFFSLELFKFL